MIEFPPVPAKPGVVVHLQLVDWCNRVTTSYDAVP